jgi:CheY-like chemotaxis protein
MREYLARLLRAAGYQVTTVADGRAALDAARSGQPDLVLTDVMMPGLDGLGLVSALRADPRTGLIPVVFLSARAGEEAAAAGLAAGADDYLPIEANHAFLVLVGYDPGGLPYQWPHPWLPDPAADPEGHKLVQQAFAGYRQDGGGRYTVPVRHRDGHTVWLACNSASLPATAGPRCSSAPRGT